MSTMGCGSCMQRAVGCTWRLGTQKVFNEHEDARILQVQGNENMCKAAASQGFDSVNLLDITMEQLILCGKIASLG